MEVVRAITTLQIPYVLTSFVSANWYSNAAERLGTTKPASEGKLGAVAMQSAKI